MPPKPAKSHHHRPHLPLPRPSHPVQSSPEPFDILHQEIAELTHQLKVANSLRLKFLMALVTGFGTVIGATVLVALLIFILSQLASIEVIKPFIEKIVDMVKNSAY